MAKILIIEDDLDIAELISFNVANAGHQVEIANSGEKGLEKLMIGCFDLVVLDVMMPGLNGLEVCRQVRRSAKTSRIPVIMVTARDSESDRITGLEAGADDYVVKPFSVRELILRIRAKLQLEKPEHREATCFHVGSLVVDSERYQVHVGNKPVNLSITEFKLIISLVRSAGHVLSRDDLLNEVWGDTSEIDYRTVDAYVTRLRAKLGDSREMLQTIRGFGYKLEI